MTEEEKKARREQIKKLAEEAGVDISMIREPRPLTPNELEKIYQYCKKVGLRG